MGVGFVYFLFSVFFELGLGFWGLTSILTFIIKLAIRSFVIKCYTSSSYRGVGRKSGKKAADTSD